MLCRDDTTKKAAFVAAQWKQVKGPQPDVTCGCGLKLPLRFAYRCLYCGEFYCQSCAEAHFGKTREQYNAEKVGAGDTAETLGPWTGGHHWDERHNVEFRRGEAIACNAGFGRTGNKEEA